MVDAGATVWTSGAAARRCSASASRTVSVDAEPKPPRTPVDDVELPGETTRTFVPSALIWSWTSARAPSPSPTVSTTAVMPIRIPSIVSSERRRWLRTASAAVRNVSRQLTRALRPDVRARPFGPDRRSSSTM